MKESIGIVTIAYNEPALISWQLRYISEFCKDPDHQIILVDNSYKPEAIDRMVELADQYQCRYLKTSCEMQMTSQSHIAALLAAYEFVKEDYDLLAFFDHDLYPVVPFSIEGFLHGCEMVGVAQSGDPNQNPEAYRPELRALWPGCLFFRNRPAYRDIVDLAGNYDLGFDSGGNIYKLVEHVGRDQVRFLSPHIEENPYFQRGNYHYFIELAGTFIHFINGAAWNFPDQEGQEDRIASLFRILEERTGIRP